MPCFAAIWALLLYSSEHLTTTRPAAAGSRAHMTRPAAAGVTSADTYHISQYTSAYQYKVATMHITIPVICNIYSIVIDVYKNQH
jgi:hypothetical protein